MNSWKVLYVLKSCKTGWGSRLKWWQAHVSPVSMARDSLESPEDFHRTVVCCEELPYTFRMSSILDPSPSKYQQWPLTVITRNVPTYFIIALWGPVPSLLRTIILDYSRLFQGFQPLKSSLFPLLWPASWFYWPFLAFFQAHQAT